MALNDAELQAVVDSLQTLVGSPLAGVWQPKRDRVILGLAGRYLLLVPRGPYARLHCVPQRPRNPGNPFSFQGVCRSLLQGRLDSLHKLEADREVVLRFGLIRLHLRLTGRSGGLWILREDRVLAAYDGPAPETLPPLPPVPTPPGPRTPRFEPVAGQSWDSAAATWFGEREATALLHQRRVVLGRRLRTMLARDRRLLIALNRDLAKSSGADALRQQADSLASILHTLKRGAASVELVSLETPGLRWRVALDVTKSPGQNLTRMYGRVRRLGRSGERILDHIGRVEDRIRVLDGAVAVIPDAERDLLKKLEGLAPASVQQRVATKEHPWHEWRGPHGTTVLVGKNAAGNRRLTFQKARGDDFWFHLRGAPGAHLLLPMKRGKTPDLATLLAVAQICLAHAKIPEGTAADVQYTRARHVGSIKGAADGLVQVHAEKVLRVVRDPTALVGWTRRGTDGLDVQGLAELTDDLVSVEPGRRFQAGDNDRP